ncbi:IS1595 family transposase [Chelatococcus sambhunathii]|uniref:IS1595 family transposase n=1 Tax=Chelatococcus sambhunathii TaxID=363953 RepID=A0ABU1DBG9_9HYPH|nr:IS1595 family transposase [Chelatococcus sambhunathii]MDR4305452.1 IS1595 family transposase [Chelatococcus sambhunathii]
MSVLSQPQFHDEAAAFEWLENTIWNGKPICPHCGCMGRISKIKPNAAARVRMGLHRCGDCKKQFTVKVGTVFEHARMPLHKMLQAVHLMCSSKKGISAHQLHRILEVQYKTAWFLAHRIREAMRAGDLAPLGGGGGVVEVDETFIGRLEGQPKRYGHGVSSYKNTVFALVERGGSTRMFHTEGTTKGELQAIIRATVAREAVIMSDEGRWYLGLDKDFAQHHVINHSRKEYARGPITTNTVEGSFSIFKRGMKGVYQHCAEKHLHRYLAEFEFRYNARVALGVNDQMRTQRAAAGIVGKRLTYRRTDNDAVA